jgi:beta-lactamase class D
VRISFLFLLLILFTGCSKQDSNNRDIVSNFDWKTFYEEKGIEGAFVLHKFNSGSYHVYNRKRAYAEYLPASTFKILNTLISLETGVISDENEIIEWDGKKRFYDMWNRDQNLECAFKFSCVWFYQELARRVGRERMEEYLARSEYGNFKTGENIDDFWLTGDLRISPFEQIIFLDNVIRRKLPFSDRNFNILEKIMLSDSSKNYKLYAKTGWAGREDDQVGWYVGFVENEKGKWLFANNIKIDEDSDAEYRKKIAYEILRYEGIID